MAKIVTRRTTLKRVNGINITYPRGRSRCAYTKTLCICDISQGQARYKNLLKSVFQFHFVFTVLVISLPLIIVSICDYISLFFCFLSTIFTEQTHTHTKTESIDL